VNRRPIFDAVRRLRGRAFTPSEVARLDAAIDAAERADPPSKAASPLSTGASAVLDSKKGPLAAIVGAVAATSLFASVPKHEGTEYRAYRDVAGIWTICQGDTRGVRAGMVETPEGCRQRLEAQLVAHASGVMACTPRLKEEGRDWQRAAATSLAYNIGVGSWCRSSADKRFDRGDFRGGCDAFLSWNKARVNGQLRAVRGLTTRRQQERQVCLKGLV
jgi:lysozyme